MVWSILVRGCTYRASSLLLHLFRVQPATSSIQKVFLPVINSDAFYYVIMLAIFVNCIQLAATSPLEPSPDPEAMQDANEVCPQEGRALFMHSVWGHWCHVLGALALSIPAKSSSGRRLI